MDICSEGLNERLRGLREHEMKMSFSPSLFSIKSLKATTGVIKAASLIQLNCWLV